MHFQPYTKQQIIDIFKDKISQEDKTNLFSPVALQMLAGNFFNEYPLATSTPSLALHVKNFKFEK